MSTIAGAESKSSDMAPAARDLQPEVLGGLYVLPPAEPQAQPCSMSSGPAHERTETTSRTSETERRLNTIWLARLLAQELVDGFSQEMSCLLNRAPGQILTYYHALRQHEMQLGLTRLDELLDDIRAEADARPGARDPLTGVRRLLEEKLASAADALAERVEQALALQSRRTLTVAEAARVAAVKPLTVRRWLEAGRLRGAKMGDSKQAQWRIRRRDLERFLDHYVNQSGGEGQ